VVRGGRVALDDLTCTVEPGSVTGLLGPSGSGKTTFIRAIVGVQRVERGRIEVLGEPAGVSALRAEVGYMTQSGSVYDDLTIRENLRFFARIVGARADAVERALEATSLGTERDRVVGRLSGGQRTRVSLAVALLGAPRLLVLDEPTVGLDPVLRRDLWRLFHDLAAGGMTLLVSSHVMDEAERCDALLLLRDGRLLAHGTPAELRERTGAGDLEDAFLRLIEEPRA
jgi:ABC-2 type transport system ATP-binding protein